VPVDKAMGEGRLNSRTGSAIPVELKDFFGGTLHFMMVTLRSRTPPTAIGTL